MLLLPDHSPVLYVSESLYHFIRVELVGPDDKILARITSPSGGGFGPSIVGLLVG
jgi:hypothetical protein